MSLTGPVATNGVGLPPRNHRVRTTESSYMALKKSELYSSLWSSCDELRGGMDASQYKDYVLVLLFIKYVSDKYAGQPFAAITVPTGSSFKDMVALKGKSDIGDKINSKIIAPLAAANKLSDMPDFNDATKLGSGKEMVDRLGRVRIAAPSRMKLDTIRVFAISKLSWIKLQQRKLAAQDRESKRSYSERESHYLWGRRYLLSVVEKMSPLQSRSNPARCC